MNFIGEILYNLRISKGLQLQDVEKATNISVPQLSRIENGKRVPSIENLQKLSLLYNIDLETLNNQRDSDKVLTELEDRNTAQIQTILNIAENKLALGKEYIQNFFTTYISLPIQISSRRYIGSKAKLIDWIFETIENHTEGINSFCDIFAGTGIVASNAIGKYNHVIINDLLYSNNIIYRAFFGPGDWDKEKLCALLTQYNALNPKELDDNYFSLNYGDKFFEYEESKRIGYIRQNIEDIKETLTDKEYCILLTTLIYNIDKIANTLGHFEAYIRKPIQKKKLELRLIDCQSYNNIEIHRSDANELAKEIQCDMVYIDPPYNSRQYSRFYHVYETLVKWDMPELYGVAMKPKPENMSAYCSSKAAKAMRELIQSLKCKYIAVSYNNTYNSKSNSSENKIALEELTKILEEKGKTEIFEHSHNPFNAGKTEFKDHKEFLFITTVHE